MTQKRIWIIEDADNRRTLAPFTSKKRAVEAILLWLGNNSSFKIVTKIHEINVHNSNTELVEVYCEDLQQHKIIRINPYSLNSGARLLLTDMDTEEL
jgi:hypothetical protein